MDLIARAVALGLRSLAAEFEDGRLDVARVLNHVAGPPALAPAAPPAAPPSKRRRRRRRSRPAAAPQEPEPEAEEPEPEAAAEAASRACVVAGGSEARELVTRLEARCGSLRAVSERHGLALPSLRRWAEGLPASPGSLERLRSALGPGARVESSDPG